MKRSLGIGVVCLVVLTLSVASPADAADFTVDCDGDPADFATIQDAVNAIDSGTITVTGTCDESVTVNDRQALTIQGPDGGSATVNVPDGGIGFNLLFNRNVAIRRFVIDGNSGFADGVFSHSSSLILTGVTIQNMGDAALIVSGDSSALLGGFDASEAVTISNNTFGIIEDASYLELRGGVTVENSEGDGLNLEGGRTIILSPRHAPANIVRNNGQGITAHGNENLDLAGLNTIQNNGANGIVAFDGAAVGLGGSFDADGVERVTTIEGHTQSGVFALSAEVRTQAVGSARQKIRNNGSAGNANSAGIRAGRGTTLALRAASISNNTGAGILADPTTSIDMFTTSISGNSGDGLKLLHLSAAQINTGNSITGNSGSAITCDSTSVAFGELAGISPIQCGGGGGGKGKGGGTASVESSAQQKFDRQPNQ